MLAACHCPRNQGETCLRLRRIAAMAHTEVDLDSAVRQRYSRAAREPEPSLCCPTRYPQHLLSAIPEEVLARDFGCGDPTRYLRPGETVLDLGSGSGKLCFIAAQVVGPSGRVIGVDDNDEMLAVARRAAPIVAERVGYANVEFVKSRIESLARISGDSIDVVLSSCVLNLVRPEQKPRLFEQITRVLRAGGRAVISDIVSSEDVPERLMRDPELWSGCVSGALREDRFLAAFASAGLHGVTLLSREPEPWRAVLGIEFRSVTVAAYKAESGACDERGHVAIYRGPFPEVQDDEGHSFPRGVPVPVCERTFAVLGREPYRELFELVSPSEPRPRSCNGGGCC
jgi:arsenite methyltransferase